MEGTKETEEKFNVMSKYSEKLWKIFKKWKMRDKIAEELSFHLADLAFFSPKYKTLIDNAISKKTEKEFIESLGDLEGELLEMHEVKYHIIPAQKLLSAWLKKSEDR